MENKQEIFTKKQFKAEVKSANVTDGGLALKLVVPFTEMMAIIPTIAESIGTVIDFEYTLPQGNLLNVVSWQGQDQTKLDIDPQINKNKDRDLEE